MTIETIPRIMQRVKMAPPSRAISVFIVREKKKAPKLDALYAHSVEAVKRKNTKKKVTPKNRCKTCGHITHHYVEEWIGDFHNHMEMVTVRNFLQQSIGEK